MLYLIKCSNFSKVGYASDIIKRIGDYYSQNPCFELLGIKEGTIEDEHKYHERFEEYAPIPKTEWRLLPDDILEELKKEFNEPPSDIKVLSVLGIMKLKTNSIEILSHKEDIDKYLKNCNITLQEFVNLFSNIKTPRKREINTKLIANKNAYYTKHPEQKKIDIEKARPTVVKMIKTTITEPIIQGVVKDLLQDCYNEVGLLMTANTTDINKIWLPGEYITKTRTYKNVQAGFVYPKDFKFQGNKKPVKKIAKDGTETIYESARAAAFDNGYAESTGVVKRIQAQTPDKNGNIYQYI